MRSNVKRLAVFCTLLMLWSAIAVVAHHHSTKSESVRCTVCVGAHAQSGGSSTSVTGTVADPTGAVVANATVEIHNPVSGFERTTITDSAGRFTIPNVPFNPYHLTVTGQGFAAFGQDIDVRSVVPVALDIKLRVAGSTQSVTVEAAGQDLLENDPTFHTDVD